MRLKRLPPNITGLFDKGEEPYAPDVRTFKHACHLVAQMESGAVERMEFNLLSRSYFGATIKTKIDHLSILCNNVYPYLAFVPANAFGLGFTELTFLESNRLAAAFAGGTIFQALDAIWLEAGLSSELLTELTHSERSELAYWKPKRIGDVVFNAWD